jgi:hypothetical protein
LLSSRIYPAIGRLARYGRHIKRPGSWVYVVAVEPKPDLTALVGRVSSFTRCRRERHDGTVGRETDAPVELSESGSTNPRRGRLIVREFTLAILWVPKTSSQALTRIFDGLALTAKMRCDAFFCLPGLRSRAPASPALMEQAGGPGHRGCRPAPRGCCLAAPGDAARSSSGGPGRTHRVEPGTLGGSSETLLRPARDPAPLASRSGAPEMEIRTPTAWTPGAARRHRLLGRSPGPGEPDLGISADSGGAGRHRCPVGAIQRLGHPAPVGAGNLVRTSHQDFRWACPDGKDDVWRSPSYTWPSFVCSSWSVSHGAGKRTWPSRLSYYATRLPSCGAR